MSIVIADAKTAHILAFILSVLVGMRIPAATVSLDLRPPEARQRLCLSATEGGVIRKHRLPAGAASVSGLNVGDRLDLQLFADRAVSVVLERTSDSLTGRSFLARSSADGDLDTVVLETESGLVVDVTDWMNDRVWQVVSGADGVAVREVKPEQGLQSPCVPLFPKSDASPIPILDVTIDADAVTVVTNGMQTGEGAVSVTPVPTPDRVALQETTELPTVDILVAYDTDAVNWATANGYELTTFAETCVQKMNTAIANTGLDTKFGFRLVGTYEIGGSAGGNLEYALEFASGTTRGTLNGVSWAGVAEQREALFADIVCTLVDTGSATGYTGLGWSLTTNSVPATCGFNVCAIRSVATSHTMTHEVGHNMGAGHATGVSDENNRGPQYYPYSSGYYFTAGGKKYHTIMAYNADGYGNYYTSAPYFSSPNHTFGGTAVGDETHNNSLTLELNYAMIVANRQAPYVSPAIGVGLDAETYVWTTDGSYPWELDTSNTVDGVDSVCSSRILGCGRSWTETRVNGPATLSFRYMLVSYKGQFRVTCDGEQIFSFGDASTENPYRTWRSATQIAIPSGVHTIRFEHLNNSTSYYPPANAVWIDRLSFAGGSPVLQERPSIRGDEAARVTGDATNGYTVIPREDLMSVEVIIPDGLDAGKVVVEVSPEVQSLKTNGAGFKIVRSDGPNRYDITAFLDVPAAADGVIPISAARVKSAYAKEILDVTKGAQIDLTPTAPFLKTVPTKPGLTYTLWEGFSLHSLTRSRTTVGDGEVWIPLLTVRGGSSGFYTINVSK